jgi:hypothetical protein
MTDVAFSYRSSPKCRLRQFDEKAQLARAFGARDFVTERHSRPETGVWGGSARGMPHNGRGPRRYDLQGIWLGCHTGEVGIDWPAEFGRWLDRLEAEARSGDQRSRVILAFTARALDQLRNLARAAI